MINWFFIPSKLLQFSFQIAQTFEPYPLERKIGKKTQRAKIVGFKKRTLYMVYAAFLIFSKLMKN